MSAVLIMRSCGPDLRSHNDFQWPEAGPVSAPDWQATKECGNGLHGFLWGEGDHNLANLAGDAKWLVVETDGDKVIDLGGKVKFPAGIVVYCGDSPSAAAYIQANGGAGKKVMCSTLTGGYGSTLTGGYGSTLTGGHRSTLTGGHRSTLTGGHRSTLTGGDVSTLTGGHRSTLTGGDGSTLTGGDVSTLTGGDGSTLTGGYGSTLTGGYGSTLTGGHRSTLTGGYGSTLTGGYGSTLTGGHRSTLTGGYGSTLTGGDGSCLLILFWNGKSYKARIAQVKDEDGYGQLEPNQPYKLNEAGEFVMASMGGAA
jgi:hypothetical protein